MTATIIDRLAEKIFGSPLASAVARELADDRLATRQAQVEELRALEAQLLAAAQTQAGIRAAAADVVATQRAALTAAQERAHELERTYRATQWPLETRRDDLSNALRQSASPQIDAFVAELRALAVGSQERRDSVSEKGIDGRLYVQWSNHASVDAYVAAIARLISEHLGDNPPSVRFEALDDAALTARLTTLRASLPAIEVRPRQYHFQGGDAA